MEHGEKHITIVDDQGNEQLCEVLFTFENDTFNKSYVLYYPIDAQDDDVFWKKLNSERRSCT